MDFYTRLKCWHQLKEDLVDSDLKAACVEIDRFWQRCPLMNHYLHPDDIDDWPNPWELLNDNNYCLYSRGLGMVYTLLLLGVNSIDLVEVIDDNDERTVLVLVDNAKYVLNGVPASVVNTDLTPFSIVKHLNVDSLVKKIGKQ